MHKILLLSDVNSAHTQKWAIALAGQGYVIGIYSLTSAKSEWYIKHQGITMLNQTREVNAGQKRLTEKFGYLKALPGLKSRIQQFEPDILHAHYASSYGLLGRLAGFHPYVLSVWGSDIFDFPKRGFIAKRIIKKNLAAADYITSTSHIMAKETTLYTEKPIDVIPFGIDIEKFKPSGKKLLFEENSIVLGTVKGLEKPYCIDTLVKAFAVACKSHSNARLLIVGQGSERESLESLVKQLGLEKAVVFTGHISAEEIPVYQNSIDIFVNVPVHESFGVSVIEASACEKPVIVSRVGGMWEVVEENVTGLMVAPNNVEELAKTIERLINDKELRVKLGKAGRSRVERLYNWKDNVQQMVNIYNKILSR